MTIEIAILANKAIDICDVLHGHVKWTSADFAKVFGELVIRECATICEDASMYRVPASQYADLVRKFKQLKEEDYVTRIG